jgi:hypothetical protein
MQSGYSMVTPGALEVLLMGFADMPSIADHHAKYVSDFFVVRPARS